MILDLNYTIRVTVEDSEDLEKRVLSPISEAIEKAGGHITVSGFQRIYDAGKVIELDKDIL